MLQDFLSASKRVKGRGKADRRTEMTPEECYLDVKDFWLRLTDDERAMLLRVPIRLLILSMWLCMSSLPCRYLMRSTMHGLCAALFFSTITPSRAKPGSFQNCKSLTMIPICQLHSECCVQCVQM